MPPKAVIAPVAPPPPPPPLDPAIVAAQKVVERWQQRIEEVTVTARKVATNIHDLETQKTARESFCTDLVTKVQEAASPKPPTPHDPVPPAKGGAAAAAAKGKKNEPPPPPPPPPVLDEEELKKQAKIQQTLLTIFKKKKDKMPTGLAAALAAGGKGGAVVAAAASDNGAAANEDGDDASVSGTAPAASSAPVTAAAAIEGLPPRPPEIDADVWLKVLRLRDERIEAEDQLISIRSSIEHATARQKGLQQVEKLVKYALSSAQQELAKVTETVERSQATLSKRSLLASSQAGGLSASPPTDPKPANGQRPPSQLVAKR